MSRSRERVARQHDQKVRAAKMHPYRAAGLTFLPGELRRTEHDGRHIQIA
jgi:hypothetical protein